LLAKLQERFANKLPPTIGCIGALIDGATTQRL
jgi:hypothetical protein